MRSCLRRAGSARLTGSAGTAVVAAVALLASSPLVFTGCGSEGERSEAAAIEQAATHAVPAGLAATESGAEDVIALALSGKRDAVVSRSSDLARAARGSSLPAASAPELRRRAARVTHLARDGSFLEIALAANAMSELMPSLYRRYETPLSAGILALDYFDREAELRSLAREPQAVAAAVRQLSRTWVRVEPEVVAAGGAEEAREFRAHVAAMLRLSASSAERIQAEADHGLELVDRLEGVVRSRSPGRSER